MTPQERESYYTKHCPNPKLDKYYADFCQGRLGRGLISSPAEKWGQKIKVQIRLADGTIYSEPCGLVGGMIVPCRLMGQKRSRSRGR